MRDCTPPPHDRLHAAYADHPPTTQSTAAGEARGGERVGAQKTIEEGLRQPNFGSFFACRLFGEGAEGEPGYRLKALPKARRDAGYMLFQMRGCVSAKSFAEDESLRRLKALPKASQDAC